MTRHDLRLTIRMLHFWDRGGSYLLCFCVHHIISHYEQTKILLFYWEIMAFLEH
jgi:hypothetical protein